MHYIRMCSSVMRTCFITSRIAKYCAIDHLYLSALAEGRKVLSKASEKPFSCTRVSLAAQVAWLYKFSVCFALPVAEFSHAPKSGAHALRFGAHAQTCGAAQTASRDCTMNAQKANSTPCIILQSRLRTATSTPRRRGVMKSVYKCCSILGN